MALLSGEVPVAATFTSTLHWPRPRSPATRSGIPAAVTRPYQPARPHHLTSTPPHSAPEPHRYRVRPAAPNTPAAATGRTPPTPPRPHPTHPTCPPHTLSPRRTPTPTTVPPRNHRGIRSAVPKTAAQGGVCTAPRQQRPRVQHLTSVS